VTKLYRRYGRKKTVGTLKSAFLSGMGRRALSPDSSVPALLGVSFEIAAGEMVGVVGPNGSGKSTLIRGWIGFEPPSEGRLVVDGIDPQRDRQAAVLRSGYVPQQPALYRGLTIAEHIDLATTLRHGFDAHLAQGYVERLAIPIEARANELSGGEQAQVGLALALGTRASILLLDEPLASLDPLARREFLHVLVTAVKEEGHTVLLSSHVITDIEQACDRLVVLGRGRTLLDLSIDDALAHHRVVPSGDGSATDGLVGTFPTMSGERLALVRVGPSEVAPAAIGRPATLEEVVIGHLAVGRQRRGEAVAASAPAGEAS
jgi:ABC-2 type transport system ATP-binding protein